MKNAFDLMKQDQVWVTGSGEQVAIADMDWVHANNTARYLRRRFPPSWWQVMVVDPDELDGILGDPQDFEPGDYGVVSSLTSLSDLHEYGSVDETPLLKALDARIAVGDMPADSQPAGKIPRRLDAVISNAWEPDGDPWTAKAFIDMDRARSMMFDRHRKGTPKMSPSKALGCTRSAYYQMMRTPALDRSDGAVMKMAVGTAMHGFVEQWPDVWAELTEEERAEFVGSLMDRCPDGEAETHLRPVFDGIPWSMFVDFKSKTAELVVDYKSKGSFPAMKMYEGELPASAGVLQLGIYGEAIEQVEGWYPQQGRLANWPKEPPTAWEVDGKKRKGKVNQSFDVEDGNWILVDHPINLTDEGIRAEVLTLIERANRVWRIAVRDRFMKALAAEEHPYGVDPLEIARLVEQGGKAADWILSVIVDEDDKVFTGEDAVPLALRCLRESGTVPRWLYGLPPNARFDPNPRGSKNPMNGAIVWDTGHETLIEEDWRCRLCEFRPTCLSDWREERGESKPVTEVFLTNKQGAAAQ